MTYETQVRGPEIHGEGQCHVNIEITPGNNYHVYYTAGRFVTDITGPVGSDPWSAAARLSTAAASELSLKTGKPIAPLWDWFMGVNDLWWAGLLPGRLAELQGVEQQYGGS
jgi:hypothetical protein